MSRRRIDLGWSTHARTVRARPSRGRWRGRAVAVLLPVIGWAVPADAGPPFNTEFAAPIGYGNGEVDVYAQTTHIQGDTSASLPAIQADYGVLPNVEVRAVLPFAFDSSAGRQSHYGLGDVQLGVKYRFIEDGAGAWWPQVSVFPLLLVPTGDQERGLGQGHATYSLPLWLQKDFGPWTVYGGGGYSFEYGLKTRNSWFAGIAALRRIDDKFALGGEVFYKEARIVGTPSGTNLSLGGSYNLSATYHVYFALSRSVERPSRTNEGSLYVALAVTF